MALSVPFNANVAGIFSMVEKSRKPIPIFYASYVKNGKSLLISPIDLKARRVGNTRNAELLSST